MYVRMCDNYIFTENHIDGIALIALPEDFEEFKHLIPSRLRMRIKALIRNWHSSGGTLEVQSTTVLIPADTGYSNRTIIYSIIEVMAIP